MSPVERVGTPTGPPTDCTNWWPGSGNSGRKSTQPKRAGEALCLWRHLWAGQQPILCVQFDCATHCGQRVEGVQWCDFWDGYDMDLMVICSLGTIFAYGQTGTGKTFTVRFFLLFPHVSQLNNTCLPDVRRPGQQREWNHPILIRPDLRSHCQKRAWKEVRKS
jgi:hypothetical protein